MMGLFWRIWAVLLVLSIFWLGWAMKTSQPAEAQFDVLETISAKEFRLVDDQGKTRAMLTMGADGSPGLALWDAQRIRALLAVFPHGSPGLSLYDAQGEERAVLDVSPEGTPGLLLTDTEGRTLFSAP